MEYFRLEDFAEECGGAWNLSEENMRELRKALVGTRIPRQKFTQKQLADAGYKSWRHYTALAAIRNW